MSDAGKAAQSAREVVREALEAFEDWATSEPMAMTLDELADDQPPVMAKSVRRIARAALALRALLARPPSDTVTRLVEAAEAAVRTVMDDAVARGWGTVEKADAMAQRSDLHKEAIAPFRAAMALREALAAHGASVDALSPGLLPVTIARVNAALDAERAKTEAMKRERDEARKARDAAFARRDEAAASLSRSDGLLRIAEKERDEARKKRDDLRFERDEARKERDALFATRESDRRMLKNRDEDYEQAAEERDALKTEVERLRAHLSTAEGRVASCGNYFCKEGRHVGACPRASTPPPSPSPLDPRALVIYGGAVQVWAAIPRANVFSVADQVFEAAEILRAAEAEAKKGVGGGQVTEMTPEAIRDAEALVRADLREMRHRHRTTGLTPSQHYWTETAACWLVDDLMAALCEVSLARAEQARKGVGK